MYDRSEYESAMSNLEETRSLISESSYTPQLNRKKKNKNYDHCKTFLDPPQSNRQRNVDDFSRKNGDLLKNEDETSLKEVVDDLKDYLSDSEDRFRSRQLSLEYRIAKTRKRKNSREEKQKISGDQSGNSRNEVSAPDLGVREDSLARVRNLMTSFLRVFFTCFSSRLRSTRTGSKVFRELLQKLSSENKN